MFAGTTSNNGISLVRLDPGQADLKVESVTTRIRNGKVELRVKVPQGDAINDITVTALHDGYVPSGHAVVYKENPFANWRDFTRMRPNKINGDYFDAVASHRELDVAAASRTTRFLLTLRSQDKSRIANYFVSF